MFPVSAGVASRLTGFSLHLREAFQNRDRDDANADTHWYDQRKAIFKLATDSWNSDSQSNQEYKQIMNETARNQRKEAHRERDLRLRDKRQHEKMLNKRKCEVEHLQLGILHGLFDSGLLCPDGLVRTDPSLLKPLAVAAHESSKNALVPEGETGSMEADRGEGQVTTFDWSSVDPFIQASRIVELLDLETCSLHGIGDNNYAIAEKLLESATEHTGFLQASHSQFHREHSSICEMVPDLNIDDRTSIDNGLMSCEMFLGRFCRKDIGSGEKYKAAISMLRNIVRITMNRRSVVCGKTFHLGMDNHWPVIVLRCSESAELYGWLAYRICYNPYEIDFIKCAVDPFREMSDDGTEVEVLYLTPLFEPVNKDAAKHLPYTDSMTEFAVWYSQQQAPQWNASLYLAYDLEGMPVQLVLRPQHETGSTLVSMLSFEHLVEPVRKKGRTDLENKDKDEAVPSDMLRLMKRLDSMSGSGGGTKTADSSQKKKKPVATAKAVDQLSGIIDDRSDKRSFLVQT